MREEPGPYSAVLVGGALEPGDVVEVLQRVSVPLPAVHTRTPTGVGGECAGQRAAEQIQAGDSIMFMYRAAGSGVHVGAAVRYMYVSL